MSKPLNQYDRACLALDLGNDSNERKRGIDQQINHSVRHLVWQGRLWGLCDESFVSYEAVGIDTWAELFSSQCPPVERYEK